jgi:hypothetical protein
VCKLNDLRNVRLSLITGAGVQIATHNPLWSIVAGVAAEVVQRFGRLSELEALVWDVAAAAAAPASIYEAWIDTPIILARLPENVSRTRAFAALREMTSRGIVEEVAGCWRAVK